MLNHVKNFKKGLSSIDDEMNQIKDQAPECKSDETIKQNSFEQISLKEVRDNKKKEVEFNS